MHVFGCARGQDGYPSDTRKLNIFSETEHDRFDDPSRHDRNRSLVIRVGRKEQKMKSYIVKPAEVERKWYVVDAEGKTLYSDRKSVV